MNTSKVALVTGGSRGLGKNSALKIAEKGLDVIITYHSNKEEAENVVTEIKALGRNAAAFQLDTRDTKSFDAFIKNVTDHLKENAENGNIDYLINNAGTALYSPITETTEEQVDDMFNIHFQRGVLFNAEVFAIHQRWRRNYQYFFRIGKICITGIICLRFYESRC